MENIETVTAAAKGISDYGALMMMAGAYLVISMLMMLAVFRWFKSIINDIIVGHTETMRELLQKTDAQNELLNDIADGMRPTTLLQVKSISNTCFDLSIERVMRIIKKIREENHIKDIEATRTKIRILLTNLHEDRKSRFDVFSYRGHAFSYFVNREWIDWVSEVVEKEVYTESVNNGRAFTNVDAVYSRIRLDFYDRLKR